MYTLYSIMISYCIMHISTAQVSRRWAPRWGPPRCAPGPPPPSAESIAWSVFAWDLHARATTTCRVVCFACKSAKL